jgi:hypothetical protein
MLRLREIVLLNLREKVARMPDEERQSVQERLIAI